MCMECDGYSDDEIYAHYDELIDKFGWMVLHIGGGSVSRPPWSYTLGLSQRFDHPELVAVGLPQQMAHGLLNDLARRVAAGERFTAGATARNPNKTLEVGFVDVHPLLWEGSLFNMWLAYYESRGMAPDQRALQTFLPVAIVAPRAKRWQPCLDDPECRIAEADEAPNRHPFPQHRRKRSRRR